MIQSTYRKGNRLAWTGFILIMIGSFVGVFVNLSGAITAMPGLMGILGLVLMVWGSALSLKAKGRSLWWLLLLSLGIVMLLQPGVGIIPFATFVAILFMLKDKSIQQQPTTPLSPENQKREL